jgi:hypothetical protein
MITIRQASERGHANHGWLDTYHTFSFGSYHDPDHMGFRALRVINDDTVAAGQGFGTHAHDNMEIVSYVLEGALEHKDSMGTGSVLRPGDVQRMSAGTGVTHSEFNHSDREALHFLQIWLKPERKGVEPSYEERHFPADQRQGQLRLIVSPDGRDNSLSIHQDVAIYAALLGEGDSVAHQLSPERHAWVQVARGAISLNGIGLSQGDGAAVSEESRLGIEGRADAELLLFDLA